MARSVYKQPTYKNIHDSTSSKTPRPPSLPDYVVHLRSRIWEGVTARVMKVHLSLLTGRMVVQNTVQLGTSNDFLSALFPFSQCPTFLLVMYDFLADSVETGTRGFVVS